MSQEEINKLQSVISHQLLSNKKISEFWKQAVVLQVTLTLGRMHIW